MARPKAFQDYHFLSVLPSNPQEAKSTAEVSELVNCSRALANRELNKLVSQGVIKSVPGEFGRQYYYRVSTQPDYAMPRVMQNNGILIRFDALLKQLSYLEPDKRVLNNHYSRLPVWAVLELYFAAGNQDNSTERETSPPVVNQRVRGKLLAEIEKLENRKRTLQSILNDPYLSGDEGALSQATDAMLAMMNETGFTLSELAELVNIYRAKVGG